MAKNRGKLRPTMREELQDAQDQIRLALEVRDDQIRLDGDDNQTEWDVAMRFYRSDPTTHYSTDEHVQVNLIWAYVESVLPSLAYRNPVFSAKPLADIGRLAQETTEAVVTEELRRCGLKRRIRRSILDMVLCSKGIIQLGYWNGGLVGQGAKEGAVSTTGKGIRKHRNSDVPFGIRPDSIYVQDIRPWNFVIDPAASCLEEATWAGVSYVRRLDDVKRDPQYSETRDLQPNCFLIPQHGRMDIDEMEKQDIPVSDASVEYVRLWQFWDIRTYQILTVALGHDKLLNQTPWTLPVERFPFYIMSGTDDNERFWSQSPVAPWMNNVDELNLTLSSRLSHLKRFVRKYLYDKDSLSDEDMAALKAPIDGSCVGVDATDGDVRGKVAPLQDAPIPADSYAYTSEINDRIEQVSGHNRLDQGAMRPGERPAAEINRLAAGSNIRRQGLADRVISPLLLLAEDSRRVMEKHYSKERVIRLTGKKGEAVWQPYHGTDLAGEYLWECSIDDMQPETRESRIQKAVVQAQVMTPYGEGGWINLQPIIQNLGDAVGVKNLEFLPRQETMPKAPDQEWSLMQRGEIQVPTYNEDHVWHIEVHSNMQLNSPEAQRNPAAQQALMNHLEAHKGIMLGQQQAQQGLAKTQQPQQGGQPGPAPGQTNNASGAGGPFAGGPDGMQPGQLQDLMGGGGL